ncbi:MAG: helix-turn-helix domain-containing protein [Oscillospiraceae bacterium]|nr:helix-turn-helix transcriptional regulator [Oscillospiraceae bacterium]
MKIINVGYNHCHDSDFYIDRPEGSGDNLLILLKTDAVFNIDGKDIKIPENSFFMYKKGRPQRYRCVYQSVFANDWVHFEFEGDEEKEFFNLGLDYETPVLVEDMNFISFCIKMMASENYSDNMNRHQSICHYMFLIFSKVGEYAAKKAENRNDSYYEMLSTVRNKIYSRPYEHRTAESSAHEVRMSVSNFQHLYKKYFGVTLFQDIIRSRTEYACMLLKSTNFSAVEVAQKCGYNHYAHFVRQFKQTMGISPSEFRKK